MCFDFCFPCCTKKKVKDKAKMLQEKQPDDGSGPATELVPMMFVTANVGSLFEKESLQSSWMAELAKVLETHHPEFLAVHMQEVGGKGSDGKREKVEAFVELLRKFAGNHGLTKISGYLDTDNHEVEQYSALGAVYFVKESLDIEVYNYVKNSYEPVGTHYDLGGKSEIHRKVKFAKGQFGIKNHARKGFIHTKWRVDGRVVSTVNIHLFHDDSNIVAASTHGVSSCYAQTRAAALQYVLNDLESDAEIPEKRPRKDSDALAEGTAELLFLFGDFNFRLRVGDALRFVCGVRPRRPPSDKEPEQLVYTKRGSKSPDLTLSKKKITYTDPNLFLHDIPGLLKFDNELDEFPELKECAVTWKPTYPFSEGEIPEKHAGLYGDKRPPAWPDRVLMDVKTFESVANMNPHYNTIGLDACMGDHKPVYLSISLPVSR
eukprot:m.3180 g.3180  ORF g.3180 m.3180 type:complete len:432 (-) comp2708_c0_seq1:68-1363(-)